MNPKKQHEIAQMSQFVDAECRCSNCGVIVDVGSGLVGKLQHIFNRRTIQKDSTSKMEFFAGLHRQNSRTTFQ